MENKSFNNDHKSDDNKIKTVYRNYMDNIEIDSSFHQQLLRTPSKSTARKVARKSTIRQLSHLAATISIVIISFGLIAALMNLNGGSKDSASAPYQEDSSKSSEDENDYIKSPEDQTSNEVDKETSNSTFPIFFYSDGSSTYNYFTKNYELEKDFLLPEYSFDDGITPIYKATDTSEKTLKAWLPKGLINNPNLISQEIEAHSGVSTLTTIYQMKTDNSVKTLAVNIHPILDFERNLLVSANSKELYSLIPTENPELPSSITDYTGTLLYPIFTKASLSKEILNSRVYEGDNITSISFGIYTDGYVITYDSYGLSVEELSDWLFN